MYGFIPAGDVLSVRCPDLRGVRFSEVSIVLVLVDGSFNLFLGACLLLGGSDMRGSTVHVRLIRECTCMYHMYMLARVHVRIYART